MFIFIKSSSVTPAFSSTLRDHMMFPTAPAECASLPTLNLHPFLEQSFMNPIYASVKSEILISGYHQYIWLITSTATWLFASAEVISSRKSLSKSLKSLIHLVRPKCNGCAIISINLFSASFL